MQIQSNALDKQLAKSAKEQKPINEQLDPKELELNQVNKRIEIRNQLAEISKEITHKKDELEKLSPSIQPSSIKLAEQSDQFSMPEGGAKGSRALWDDLLQDLGLKYSGSKKDVKYQRKLIFGFMDEKHKVADIVADLKNTLGEGKPGDPKDVQMNGVCSFQVLDEFFEDALGKKHHAQYKLSLLGNLQEDFQKVTDKTFITTKSRETWEYRLHQELLGDNEKEMQAIEKMLALLK